MSLHRTKGAETSNCNPDQFGRILKSDQTSRSFDGPGFRIGSPGFHLAFRFKVLPFRRPMGARQLSVLSELSIGETGVLVALDLPESVQNHLMHMGFVPDALVTALRRAPAGDPTVYGVDGMEIALRHETAEAIRVRSAENGIANDSEIHLDTSFEVPELIEASR
jgi:Fe2+ transport system protein FeoA